MSVANVPSRTYFTYRVISPKAIYYSLDSESFCFYDVQVNFLEIKMIKLLILINNYDNGNIILEWFLYSS